jgi:hypothetical protein
MNTEVAKLGRASAGFAMSCSITVLFNTALAWVKDAYQPLNSVMNALAWHNWITQGIADVLLFISLGLVFTNTNWVQRISPNRLILFLAVAVAAAGLGLFVWYAVF